MHRPSEKILFDLPGVCAHLVDYSGASSNVAGVLAIVQRHDEIFIEWAPFENLAKSATPPTSGNESSDWELPEKEKAPSLVEKEGSPGRSSGGAVRSSINKVKINVELKDLRSFVLLNECSDTDASIKFVSADGSNLCPLYFTMGGCLDFVTALHRLRSLKRSAKDNTLIIICDERMEALQKSVSVLFESNSQSTAFLTKLFNDPYSAAVSGLGKVTNYLQENVLPNLVLEDFDKVDQKEQQYAVKSLMELVKAERSCDKLRTHNANGFEYVAFGLPDRPPVKRDPPVTVGVWDAHINQADGSFIDVADLKARIFHGGVEPALRKIAWKFLLGVFDWNSTKIQREEEMMEKKDYYYKMKLQWKTITVDQQSRFSEFRERSALIDKDVTRTDRTHDFFEGDCNSNLTKLKDVLNTYVMYNFDLGYVQGMSDLLSPLMVVMGDEVDSFWAFVGFMRKVQRNFEMDQQSIKHQLMQLRDLLFVVNAELANYLESSESDNMYFCFRWILVLFKREFSFHDIMRLWEVLWTDLPCKNFHLLICLAVLDQQKDLIVENKFGFTEVLKHINDLSMRLNLDDILKHAEGLFYQLAASQGDVPAYVGEYLGFDAHAHGSTDGRMKKLDKIDDWTSAAKVAGGSKNPGCAERVKLHKK